MPVDNARVALRVRLVGKATHDPQDRDHRTLSGNEHGRLRMRSNVERGNRRFAQNLVDAGGDRRGQCAFARNFHVGIRIVLENLWQLIETKGAVDAGSTTTGNTQRRAGGLMKVLPMYGDKAGLFDHRVDRFRFAIEQLLTENVMYGRSHVSPTMISRLDWISDSRSTKRFVYLINC